jgi:hypothetical protein
MTKSLIDFYVGLWFLYCFRFCLDLVTINQINLTRLVGVEQAPKGEYLIKGKDIHAAFR